MKVVASTKLTRAQKTMQTSRAYQVGDKEFYTNAETKAPETPEKSLFIAVSSDKGLCGSVHSQIAKFTRSKLAENPSAKIDIVTIGDKVKAQLLRTHPSNLVLSFNGVGKEPPTFNEAALISDEIMKLGAYDKVEIFYNKFTSSVSFEPTAFPVFTENAINESEKLSTFEVDEESNVPSTVAEFSLANTIFSAMSDGFASEISARRNAMDNASKNAGDMISKYTILYNRQRQAVITNELVDIITGASSLD